MAVFNNILAGAAGQTGGAAAGYEIERSLRFNSVDDTYLYFDPSGHGNRKVFTFSFWIKRSKLGTNQLVLYIRSGAGATGRVVFDSSDRLQVKSEVSGTACDKVTTAKFRDCSAWQHFVVKFDAVNSNCDIYHNGVEIEDFDTNTEPTNVDHYFGGDFGHYLGGWIDTENLDGYLAEVHMVNGSTLDATDFGEFDDNNVWQPKAYAGTYGTNGFHLDFSDNSSNAALGTDSSGNNNTWTVNNLQAAGSGFNQSNTWSNDLSSPDGTLNNPANAFDGSFTTYAETQNASETVQLTFSPSINCTSSLSIKSRQTVIGGVSSTWTLTYKIYTTDSNTPAFTQTNVNGQDFNYPPSNWSNDPISKIEVVAASLTTLVAGFVVDGQTLVDIGISDPLAPGIDSLIDTPTNYEAASGNNGGNYCTLNPLESALTGLNNGNLNSGSSGAASWKICTSTLAVSSGKYYWEGFTDTTASETQGWQWGFCNVTPSSLTNPYGTGKWSYQHAVVRSQSSSGTTVGTTAVANDLLAYALDMDAGTCKLYVNNSLVYTFTGITGTITPFVGSYNTPTVTVNFGQRPFAYTPPTGYVSLCTTNLPDPTIADGSTYFDTLTWTATNDSASSKSFTGLSFSPDLVWSKARGLVYNHNIYDTVRGAGSTKALASNDTGSEPTGFPSVYGYLSSFDSAGFTFAKGTDSTRPNAYYDESGGYVAWCWDAGTSTVSNTDGSITSSVRANQTTGFSICTYTGSTGNQSFGHGLNAAPKFIAIKNRSNAANWFVMVDIGTTYYKYGHFNTTDAFADASAQPVSSTTVTLGNNNAWFGANGDNYVAYCWAPVEGYSAFGSYTGNGSADGTFVYTGMRPAFLLVKSSSSASWYIFDSARNTFNSVTSFLVPNSSDAEVSASPPSYFNFLSNGFKATTTNTAFNGTGGTYIYAAFAEHPFKTARAR